MSSFRSSFNKSLFRDSLEVSLVFDVFECKRCKTLWPYQNDTNRFGVLPSFDFNENYPNFDTFDQEKKSFTAIVKFCEGHFPKPSVLSGCRKAPILLIDVNPRVSDIHDKVYNACQVLPYFTNENDYCDIMKYAYYFRYRQLGSDYVNLEKNKLIRESCIYTEQKGIVNEIRIDQSARSIFIELKYIDGCSKKLNLSWSPHESCYHVFVTEFEEFRAGMCIAARIDYEIQKNIPLFSRAHRKYAYLNKILSMFGRSLQNKLNRNFNFDLGEDLSFLNLTACASPEWHSDLLDDSNSQIVQNCVLENKWALKHILQSQPAVILLNGEKSFQIFNQYFANYIHPYIPAFPADREFGLFRHTSDIDRPHYFEFNDVLEDEYFHFRSRLVVLPHFHHPNSFVPHIRISERNWDSLTQSSPNVTSFLYKEEDIDIYPPEQESDFYHILLYGSAARVLGEIRRLDKHAHQFLLEYLYRPNKMVFDVLMQEFAAGNLSCSTLGGEHLDRTNGPCSYCVNRYWAFPQGCPYGKCK